jgi:DNA (cytosine-5)-methyltransferase 1
MKKNHNHPATTSLKQSLYALFAGAGGLHLGLERAGFDTLVATDCEPFAEKTHRRNWPDLPFLLSDIRKISAQQLLDLAGGAKPDMICGGPPCQGFSTLGDKLSSDPRNSLFAAYARLVRDLNPSCILIENVKALVMMYHGQYRDYIIRIFNDLGYTVYVSILNAADYGVPQIRQRVIFFGTRLPFPFAFPKATHGLGEGLLPHETVGNSIMDLADTLNGVPNHVVLDHSQKVIARYKLIGEGGKLPPPESLPLEIRRKNFGNTYKRLHRERPSLTLVPGNNAFPIHPTKHRSLTPREAARLQTFPDSFIFEGDRRKQCILVGNAVPPLFAQALGRSIQIHINGKVRPNESVKPSTPSLATLFNPDSEIEGVIPLDRLSRLPTVQGFIDLFSGAGGFTVGFSRAGWRPLLGVDSNDSVSLTHSHNFPSVPFLKSDLAEAETRKNICERLGDSEIGVVVGGPPCQGFSIFGKRRFIKTKGYDPHKDPRNRLVYSFIDILASLSPRWFVMENVPGFANLDQGFFLETVLEEFRNLGYKNAEARILNAADYGVPQLRKRLLIIGNRTGHIIPWPKRKFFSEPQDWQDPYRTVGEVLSDLAEEQSYLNHTCHVPMKHKPLLVERYTYIPEGERLDVDSLPREMRSGYRTNLVKNYSHVFKRLHRNKPAFTMVPGHNAFPIHPWLHRALTVREAARLQTFPDEMEFLGPRQEQCIQVGNAFPPLLAELIANNIRKAEVNNWFPGKVPTSAYYSLVEKSSELQMSLSYSSGIGKAESKRIMSAKA